MEARPRYILETGFAQVVHGVLRITCDRCSARIDSFHYHCLQCNKSNYDLCVKCAANGIYCQDDTHYWIKRGIEEGEYGELERFNMDGKISPSAARTTLSETKSYPSRFRPPHSQATPQSLFANEHRFIRNSDPREILIYIDGACSNNGQSNPQAGYAFVYRPSAYSENGSLTHGGTISLPLEGKGPTGQLYKHTSNRAELRAVIAALQFRDWSTDCNRSWRSLVIATDSAEYVVLNATERLQGWEINGWKLKPRYGRPPVDVANQDLWKLLLREIRKLQGEGVNVSLWPIPREWNGRADKYAKTGAQRTGRMEFQMAQPNGSVSVKLVPYPVVTLEEEED